MTLKRKLKMFTDRLAKNLWRSWGEQKILTRESSCNETFDIWIQIELDMKKMVVTCTLQQWWPSNGASKSQNKKWFVELSGFLVHDLKCLPFVSSVAEHLTTMNWSKISKANCCIPVMKNTERHYTLCPHTK